VKISNGKWTINDNAKTEFWFMKGKNIICATGENLIKVSPKTLNTESAISLKESVKQLKNEDFHKNFFMPENKGQTLFPAHEEQRLKTAEQVFIYVNWMITDHLKAINLLGTMDGTSGASLIFVQCIIGL